MTRRYLRRRFFGVVLCLTAIVVGLIASPSPAVDVVCHRGANEHAPENTLAAAQLCIDWGVQYVEIDVRTSKDGVMYILHDPWVNRTTDGKGFIFQLASAEIDKLDAGSWFDKKFAGEKVPRLEPYLRAIKGKIKVYFDVKAADLKQLVDLVYAVGMENDCFFWFDRPERALEFRQLDTRLPLKVNVKDVDTVKEAVDKYRANIVELSLGTMTPPVVEACREHGLRIMVLHTKKDPEGFRRIVESGADLVNLDHGDVFLQVQREVQAGTPAKATAGAAQ